MNIPVRRSMGLRGMSRRRGAPAACSLALALSMPLSLSLAGQVSAAQAPVYRPQHGSEILWDQYGVAHVYAKSVPDLFYCFGWALAKSHGDLLARLYAEGRGRAAEYYGASELANDRWMAINDVAARSRAWLRAQTPAFRGYLQAFAAGIDAYVAAHPDSLSVQARRVFPVSALDVIAYEQHIFQYTYAAPASRAEHLPGDPVAAASPLGEAARALPPGSGAASGAADAVLSRFAEIPGSNGWAIGPSRTTSGHAMLLMNPHLPWPAGWSTYYEIQLTAPGIDLYGATQVGLPVLRFVFSDYLGFTHTVNSPNEVTYYRISPAAGGYRFDGKVLPYQVRHQVLRVLRPDGSFATERLTIRSTVQGPIIAERDGHPIAMRVAGLDRPFALQEYWQMATAHDFADFQAAVARLQVPTFNMIYADRDGHIEYLYNGLVPRHRFGDLRFWSGIVPGDSSRTLWHDYLTYAQLPKVIDPPGGTVQNSNDPPWDAAWPQVIDPAPYADAIPASRVSLRMAQGIRMLSASPKISFDDLIRDKWSHRCELADRVLPDLLAATARYGDALARQAAQVLASWDRTTNATSRGALLFMDWMQQPGGLNGYSAKGFAQPYDLHRPLTTPSGLADPQAAVRALEAAARETIAEYGSLDRPWGEVMRLKLGSVDLPASGGPGELGVFDVLKFGPLHNGERAAEFGSSFVALVSFGHPLRAKVLLSYGSSTQPGTTHRSDQLALVSAGQLRDVWRTRAEVEAHLEGSDRF
ncbi:MAG TPA: penicillin acylase family protein [Steroidobacteraceae bacterium]|nr:penicillin acylase family protein [Steroidobacteraceae bacterium]